jgi:23S rRNA (cytidine1920-2'-O)/16S rRNA (cytidine1409-2'-O)-methyltransferase
MKKRADILIFEKGLAKSRSMAVELIKDGRIKINGKIITKNSEQIDENSEIELLGDEKQYVGRGGLKLEEALNKFKIDPAGLVVLDVGASTGGFTECLLRQGAKRVYAVDVGTDQLAPELKNDPRVVSLEKTDIRDVKSGQGRSLSEKADLAVIDVSFISLELILKNVVSLIKKDGKIIALVKPQFETEKKDKNKSGVVKNEELQKQALEKVKKYCEKINLKVLGEIDSPILGGSGNKEYFLLLQE